MNRRQLLQGGSALAAAGLLPRQSIAQTALGDGTLTTVSDGYLTLPPGLVFDPMPQDELAAVLAAYDQPADSLTPDCNLALYRAGDRVVLFDAGSGFDFMSSAGQIVDSLAAAGLGPEDITDVVFTHAHPDHIWGVTDDFDDPLFYNAVHHIGATEFAYWSDPATADTIGAERASFAAGAIRRLGLIADQIEVFEDSAEVLPGITALPSPGHTPGHTSFLISNGPETAIVLGDAIGNAHVALARPDWLSGSDQDMGLAAETRLRLVDQIALDDLLVVGFHFHSGGIGRIEEADGPRRFTPL